MLLLLACAQPVDLGAIEASLGTAAPVAMVAVTTWRARNGDVPCDLSMPDLDAVAASIPLNDDCPVPAVAGVAGSVGVAGAADETSAQLAMDFREVTGLRVDAVEGAVLSAGDDVQVVLAGESVALGDGSEVALDQSGLVIRWDPAADSYTVDGAAQVAGAGDGAVVRQIVLTGVVLSTACRENPVGGAATMQDVDAGDTVDRFALTEISFHDACDGQADIVASVGTSVGASGTAQDIDLGG